MAFCMYCGSQIPDGGVCFCPKAQADAAARAAAPQVAPPQFQPQQAPQVAPPQFQPQQAPQAAAPQFQPQQAPQAAPPQFRPQQAPQAAPQYGQAPYGQAPYGQAPQYQQAPAGPSMFSVAFGQFATIFTKPAETISNVVSGKVSFEAGMVLGGLYAIVVIISSMLWYLHLAHGGMAVLWGIITALLACGARAGMAAVIAAIGKNTGAMKQAIAASFVASIPSTICWFLSAIFGFLHPVCWIFFFIAGIGLAVAMYAVVAKAICADQNKAVMSTFIVSAVMAIGFLVVGFISLIPIIQVLSMFSGIF